MKNDIDIIINEDIKAIEEKDQVFQDFYYDWLINDIFRNNEESCNEKDFVAALAGSGGPGCDFNWLFNTNKIRLRV